MPDFKLGQKPVGLAARLTANQAKGDALATNDVNIDFTKLDPSKMTDRIGIVFDDSGSMSGRITEAHQGVEEFLRNCKPAVTAVTIYPMCSEAMPLTADLIKLANQVKTIQATGGTPLLRTLDKMIQRESLTRAIVFSDGQPDDPNYYTVAQSCKDKKIPVDTVFIGGGSDFYTNRAIQFMQNLAKATDGIFMHFDPAKMNFRTAFKYLSPGYYGMLSDKSVVSDIESGRR